MHRTPRAPRPAVRGLSRALAAAVFTSPHLSPQLGPTRTPGSSAPRSTVWPERAGPMAAKSRRHLPCSLSKRKQGACLTGDSRAGLAQGQEGWGSPPSLRSQKGATPLAQLRARS